MVSDVEVVGGRWRRLFLGRWRWLLHFRGLQSRQRRVEWYRRSTEVAGVTVDVELELAEAQGGGSDAHLARLGNNGRNASRSRFEVLRAGQKDIFIIYNLTSCVVYLPAMLESGISQATQYATIDPTLTNAAIRMLTALLSSKSLPTSILRLSCCASAT